MSNVMSNATMKYEVNNKINQVLHQIIFDIYWKHAHTISADDKYMCKYIINNRMAYSNLKLHKITNVKIMSMSQ